MNFWQYKTSTCVTVLVTVFPLLLAGCGSTSDTSTQNLQATVAVLQTQLVSQPSPSSLQATIIPSPAPTEAPQQSTALSPTKSVFTSALQEYMSTPRNEYGDAVDFLSWTESDGHILGTIMVGGFTMMNKGRVFHIGTLPVKGAHQGSSMELMIYAHDQWQTYTAIFEDNDNTLKLNTEGVVFTYHRATKADFDKEVAALSPSATPVIDPTVLPPLGS